MISHRKRRIAAQKLHTLKRLQERYDLTISLGEYKQLCRLIRHSNNDDRVRYLGKISLRLTVHAIDFKGQEIFVVYDKLRGSIATALPKDFRDFDEQTSFLTEELSVIEVDEA